MDADDETAQVLTHDIGEGNYQRTARFATVLAEVVISYDSVVVEKDWLSVLSIICIDSNQKRTP